MKKPRLREGCVASVSTDFDEARPSCVGPICDPMDHIAFQAPLSPGILQARLLQWVTIPFSRGSSRPRDGTQVSCIAGRFFTVWATREAPLGNSGWNKPAVYSWKTRVSFLLVTCPRLCNWNHPWPSATLRQFWKSVFCAWTSLWLQPWEVPATIILRLQRRKQA